MNFNMAAFESDVKDSILMMGGLSMLVLDGLEFINDYQHLDYGFPEDENDEDYEDYEDYYEDFWDEEEEEDDDEEEEEDE